MFGSKKQTLVVEGMMCGHCAAHVKEAVEALPNVISAKVDLDSKKVHVKVKEPLSKEAYEKAIADAGYTLTEVGE